MADPNSQGPIAEIRNDSSAFEQFLDRNQKLLLFLLLILVIAVGAWVVMTGVKEGADRSGGAALVAAEDAEALHEVLDTHSGSPAAGSAAVLMSDRQWEQGLQNDAIETLRQEITDRPDHPATFPARARLGARLAEQGKNAEAREAFQPLLSDGRAGYLAPYVLTSLAGIARAEGDLDQAESLLEQAVENHPGNPLANSAMEALRFVRFDMPEEVDPPAEPEPTPGTGSIDDGTGAADFSLSPEQQAAQSLFGGSEDAADFGAAAAAEEEADSTPEPETPESPADEAGKEASPDPLSTPESGD